MSKSTSRHRLDKHFFKDTFWVWGTPILLSAIIVASYRYSAPLFHTTAEFFSIIVAILFSVVAWQTHPFTRNNFLMYLGCGYFWVAGLDMLHALSYKGVNIIDIDGANTAAQFWLAARFMEVVLLVTSPIYLTRDLNRNRVFALFGIYAIGAAIFVETGHFPTTFVEGEGLTPFKIYSEYFFILVMIIAIGILHFRRDELEPKMLHIMYASIVFTMCAELSFTLYVESYGISNQAGHIFKLFSFWLIFVAIINTTLTKPFELLAKNATTYDAIPVATIVVDESNIIRQVNNFACEMSSKSEAELVGAHVHEHFHPGNVATERCKICHAVINHLPLNMYELELPQKNRWYDYTLSPIKDEKETRGMVQVIRDVSERKRAELELDKYRSKLEELVDERTRDLAVARDQALIATQAKSSFLANMSHELRTPLNSIIGFTGILKAKMVGPLNDEQVKQLGMVDDSARHLLRLINDILDLSKIEAGKVDVHITQFDLLDLVAESGEQLEVLFRGKDVELEIQKGEPVIIESDREKLHQILLNLLSNALKFTKHGYVKVSVETSGESVKIMVEDTGMGIRPENLAKIFSTFEQAENGDNRSHAGTGLGLTISRKFAHLMGGEIEVESTPGKGSIFSVYLNKHWQGETTANNV